MHCFKLVNPFDVNPILIQQFRVNRMFDQDQKRVYQELNGTARAAGVTPDADASKIF